jgi:Domain of unknown function (DUF4340)
MKLDVKRFLTNLNRTNQILVAVLVVQLIVAIIAFFPRNTAASDQAGGPLLRSFKPGDVTEITIHDKDGKQIVLAKSAAGDWVMPKADNYPVSSSDVTTLLGKVQALKTNRLIAQNRASHSRLGVAETGYEHLVEFKDAGGNVQRLYIGTSGGANATHMRVGDQDLVYLTSGLSGFDVSTQANTWVGTPYFNVDQNTIVSLTVQNAQGTFNFKKVNGAWTLDGLAAGEIANASSIQNIVSQAASISLTTPIGTTDQDRFKMKTPTATVTLAVESQATPASQFSAPFQGTPTPSLVTPQTVRSSYSLLFGAKQDGGEYVLKSSQSTFYVQVGASTAEAFANLKRADLLTPPPTPTAAPTGTPETGVF